MLTHISCEHSVPGLRLVYYPSRDQVRGTVRATHSNHKETRHYRFEVSWSKGRDAAVSELRVAAKSDDPDHGVKGIGTSGRRADVRKKVLEVAVRWRAEKIAEQTNVTHRMRELDAIRLQVSDNRTSRPRIEDVWWADGWLAMKLERCGPGGDGWWEMAEIGSADRPVAEYVARR
jgi:hypothetical protein